MLKLSAARRKRERNGGNDGARSYIYTHLLSLPGYSFPIGPTEGKQEEQEKGERSELRGRVEE